MESLRPEDPTTIGHYRILGRLGAGGMGNVFLARNPTGRAVALKVVREECAALPDFRQRFAREVKAARRVTGPWTVPVVDHGVDDRLPWYASDYLPGPSLDEAVRKYGPLPAEALFRLAADLAEALTDVHRQGLIHRDLKPANVLLSTTGPRLIDFGIARAVEDTKLTVTGGAVGTPIYMSPEQRDAQPVTPATDVYSLGLVMYFAATGKVPAVSTADPDLGPLPERLARALGDCLARDPSGRPTSDELAQRLRPLDPTTGVWLPREIEAAISLTSQLHLNLDAPAHQQRHPETVFDATASNSAPTPASDATVPPGPMVRPEASGRPGSAARSEPPAPRPPGDIHSGPTRHAPPPRRSVPPEANPPPPAPAPPLPGSWGFRSAGAAPVNPPARSGGAPSAAEPAGATPPAAPGPPSDPGNASRHSGASADGFRDGAAEPTPSGEPPASPAVRARVYRRLFDQIAGDPERFRNSRVQSNPYAGPEAGPRGAAAAPRQRGGRQRIAPWLSDALVGNPLFGLIALLVMTPGSLLMVLAGGGGPLSEARIGWQLALVAAAVLLDRWRDRLTREATPAEVRRWAGATAGYWLLMGAVMVEGVLAFTGYPDVPHGTTIFQDFTRMVLYVLQPVLLIGLLAFLYVVFALLVRRRRMRSQPLTVSR